MRAYLELTKPRITVLILVSSALGYLIGFSAHEAADPGKLFHTFLGVALVASGTATLNQWWERTADAGMWRTASRPLPSGRVSAARALGFGFLISFIGVLELFLAVNVLTAALALFTLLTCLLLYTPLKRRHWLCTAVGAVPGAMPPVIGYTAARGVVDTPVLALFAVLFLWQFPHFYSVAWTYRQDYGRAGIRMLPVVEPPEDNFRRTVTQMVFCAVLLIPVSLAPGVPGVDGPLYMAVALLSGIGYPRVTLKAARARTPVRVRAVFTASLVYLPLLYSAMALDRRWP